MVVRMSQKALMARYIDQDVPVELIANGSVFFGKVQLGWHAAEEARARGLSPTPYFFEGWDYWQKASRLQAMNLGRLPRRSIGDPLMEGVPIYDTVQRRYAGFSNVLEQLRYGKMAPKLVANQARGFDYPIFEGSELAWLYLCLVHRCTGSGASFEWDHGFRNTMVPEVAQQPSIKKMAAVVRSHPGPSCTSIGNQPPAVRKIHDLGVSRNSLQHYLGVQGPWLVAELLKWLEKQRKPVQIKEAVEEALRLNQHLGQKRFVFVLTAWVMDIAEYLPKLVDPSSDCFHGANARESWARFFGPGGQTMYDKAARLMADLTKTHPMDVEDVMCDAVRWIERYVPKNGFQHLGTDVQNSCALRS